MYPERDYFVTNRVGSFPTRRANGCQAPPNLVLTGNQCGEQEVHTAHLSLLLDEVGETTQQASWSGHNRGLGVKPIIRQGILRPNPTANFDGE